MTGCVLNDWRCVMNDSVVVVFMSYIAESNV